MSHTNWRNLVYNRYDNKQASTKRCLEKKNRYRWALGTCFFVFFAQWSVWDPPCHLWGGVKTLTGWRGTQSRHNLVPQPRHNLVSASSVYPVKLLSRGREGTLGPRSEMTASVCKRAWFTDQVRLCFFPFNTPITLTLTSLWCTGCLSPYCTAPFRSRGDFFVDC